EIGDHADALCGWRPDGKAHAGDSIHGFDVSTELFVRVVVAAFGHQMQIEIAELVGEGIGIENFKLKAFVRAALNFVAAWLGSNSLAGRPGRFKKTFGAEFDRIGQFCGILKSEVRLVSPGDEEAHSPAVFDGVRAKERKRIRESRGEKR